MKRLPIAAVIFDCDGTLVDSEVLANEVLVEYVASFGVRLSLDEAVKRYTGRKMAECVADLEQQRGQSLPDDFVHVLRQRMEEAFRSRLQPMEGAENAIRQIQVPYCVASSGPRAKIELSLTITSLRPYFPSERIFSSYEVGVWKPDPGLFLHAAKAMGVNPDRCAVVEDSLPGILAGLAAEMRVFGFDPHDSQRKKWPGAVKAFGSMSELPSLLGKVN